MMHNTYTYTARSADDPDRVMTFTLHDDQMSVSVAAPVEQIEQLIARLTKGEVPEGEETDITVPWLKPLAISLVERSTGSFNVEDVRAWMEDDVLVVKAWIRVGGLRGSPITLLDERVDNPDAAEAFVWELDSRKEELDERVLPFDYWLTWIGMAAGAFLFFVLWRRRTTQSRRAVTRSYTESQE
jgi:hypothetical protein